MLIFIVILFSIYVRRWLGWLVSNGHGNLDGLMFDHLSFSSFSVMVGFVRSKASVCPRILYDGVIYAVFKGCEFEFIVLGRIKNWVVLFGSLQDWI